MSKKKKPDENGFVYSTDPGFRFNEPQVNTTTPETSKQKLYIRLETKHRGGKAVTVIADFIGKEEDLEELGKKLKTFCGTGGSVKDREIIIQGDQREKVKVYLTKNGYRYKGQ